MVPELEDDVMPVHEGNDVGVGVGLHKFVIGEV